MPASLQWIQPQNKYCDNNDSSIQQEVYISIQNKIVVIRVRVLTWNVCWLSITDMISLCFKMSRHWWTKLLLPCSNISISSVLRKSIWKWPRENCSPLTATALKFLAWGFVYPLRFISHQWWCTAFNPSAWVWGQPGLHGELLSWKSYVHECLACVHLLHVFVVLVGTRRGHWIPWPWSQLDGCKLPCGFWERWSSIRVLEALNHWAISSLLYIHVFIHFIVWHSNIAVDRWI